MLTEEQYNLQMQRVEELMLKGSGNLKAYEFEELRTKALQCQQYEQAHFPIERPSEEDYKNSMKDEKD